MKVWFSCLHMYLSLNRHTHTHTHTQSSIFDEEGADEQRSLLTDVEKCASGVNTDVAARTENNANLMCWSSAWWTRKIFYVQILGLLIIPNITTNVHVFCRTLVMRPWRLWTVGAVTVVSKDDFRLGPSSTHLQPISTTIVLEERIVTEDIKNLPQAVSLVSGITYALHVDYPKCKHIQFHSKSDAWVGPQKHLLQNFLHWYYLLR